MENKFYDLKEILFALLATSAFVSSIYLASAYSKPWPVPEGYYTIGQSCRADNDCKCSVVHGEFDTCGKPGQYPACMSGTCGWGNYQPQKDIDVKKFQEKTPEG